MTSVYFFVPNLIGYSRIIFAILAFYYCNDRYELFFIFYALSAILDMADGYAARALGQASRFGAILDMVTDRASTTCLIVVLARFYPKFHGWYLFLITLDLVSHFTHIYSTLSRGSTSHKNVSRHNWMLHLYYTNRYVLAGLCGGNEGFFLWSYLLHFWSGPLISLGSFAAYVDLFLPVTNGSISFVQFMTFIVFFPVMFIKQLMNLIQLKQACQDIVELDEQERAAKKSAQKSQ